MSETGQSEGKDGRAAGVHDRELLTMLPAAIYTTDADGLLTFYNEPAVRLWGCTPALGEKAWGSMTRILLPDGSPLDPDACPLAVALREGHELESAEVLIERPDGVRCAVLAFPRLVRDARGVVTGGLNMLVDASQQKRQEENEHRLAAIVESSEDAIISKDLDGTVRSWNHGAERLFGYSAEEMVGSPISLLFPPSRREEEANILARIRKGERLQHYETVRVCKDGSTRDVSLTVSPLVDKSGRVVGASKIARDITQRKESERRILLLMREVNHRVKNQYAVILSMIRENARRAYGDPRFEQRIGERIMALSRSHDLLVNEDWKAVELSRLILEQARPFDPGAKLSVSGPPVDLLPSTVQYLGLAFHELAEHSARHGALSGEGGNITVGWRIEGAGEGERRLHLSWIETDADAASGGLDGFANLVLERMAPEAVSGRGGISLGEGSWRWTLEAPFHEMVA